MLTLPIHIYYQGGSFTKIRQTSLFNPSNKVWRDLKQTKTPTSPFQIGDSIRYTNEGHNEIVYLVGVITNDPDSIKYIIKLLRGNTMIVTKEFLKSGNVPDIGYIPISSK